MIRKFCSPLQDDWAEHLDLFELCYNNTKHRSTGYSPMMLDTGYEATLPLDFVIDKQITTVSSRRKIRLAEYLDKQHAALNNARNAILRAQAYQTYYHNMRNKESVYNLNDHVLLSSDYLTLDNKQAKKFRHKWIGPFKIIQKLGANSYKLKLPTEMSRIHNVFHTSVLKGWYGPPPEPITNSDSIESIVGHRKTQGAGDNYYYLIKWVNRPITQCTFLHRVMFPSHYDKINNNKQMRLDYERKHKIPALR